MGTYFSNASEENIDDINNYEFPISRKFEDLSKEKNYERIPVNVVHQIILYLKPSDFVPMFLTCRCFHRVGMSNLLWRRYYQHYFNLRDKTMRKMSDLNFRKQFFKRFIDRKRRKKGGYGYRYYGNRNCFKIVLLGDPGVGKTSVNMRYGSGHFSEHYRHTIGADFQMKHVEVNDETLSLQLWDLAGQERFVSLTHVFFRGASCCILVFDVTNRKSFENMQAWKDEVDRRMDESGQDEFEIIMCGNKNDLKEKKVIMKEEVEKKFPEIYAEGNYFETSAKSGEGIDEMFKRVALLVYNIKKTRIDDDPPLPAIHHAPSNSGGCFIM